MKAIVVDDFKQTPYWSTFKDPIPKENEVKIQVSAAALSNLVKSRANGTHYSSVANFPFVPGVDGVGRLEDGSRVYFCFPPNPFGSMAEYSVANKEACISLPDDLDDVVAASIANAAMSSWGALVYRAHMIPGETVLINGATGASGSLAIKIAKHLGAKKVIATGRHHHRDKLLALGADEVISLSSTPEELVAHLDKVFAKYPVSIVLDYLWGASAEALIQAIDKAHITYPLRFIQIGSISGQTITMNASPLRSTNLQLLGSGLGSISNHDLLHSISEAFKVANRLGLSIETEVVPMSQAANIWNKLTGTMRVVFTC